LFTAKIIVDFVVVAIERTSHELKTETKRDEQKEHSARSKIRLIGTNGSKTPLIRPTAFGNFSTVSRGDGDFYYYIILDALVQSDGFPPSAGGKRKINKRRRFTDGANRISLTMTK